MKEKILLTGGTGYIGSHTYVSLINAGYLPIILDNFCNSNPNVLKRLTQICGTPPIFIQGDVRDKNVLAKLFADHNISAVIHFAGLKAVNESIEKPLEYYDNNVGGTLTLLNAMRQANISTLVFSSSATVYGDPATTPIKEDFPRKALNPYGQTKLFIEDMLADLHDTGHWRIARLRYFNPVGAHESGLIGEDPIGIPNNLMPYIAQVAAGAHVQLNVFGGDYPTPDGTAIRDYIHVMDVAEGHVTSLDYLRANNDLLTVNLGTGHGVSVLQMIKEFEQASGKKVPYKVVARRKGDSAQCWADPTLAKQKMAWVARRSLNEMCMDTWRWQLHNPNMSGETTK